KWDPNSSQPRSNPTTGPILLPSAPAMRRTAGGTGGTAAITTAMLIEGLCGIRSRPATATGPPLAPSVAFVADSAEVAAGVDKHYPGPVYVPIYDHGPMRPNIPLI